MGDEGDERKEPAPSNGQNGAEKILLIPFHIKYGREEPEGWVTQT